MGDPNSHWECLPNRLNPFLYFAKSIVYFFFSFHSKAEPCGNVTQVSNAFNPLINIIHDSNSLLKESELGELNPSIWTDMNLQLHEVLRIDDSPRLVEPQRVKQHASVHFEFFGQSKENLPLENNGNSWWNLNSKSFLLLLLFFFILKLILCFVTVV